MTIGSLLGLPVVESPFVPQGAVIMIGNRLLVRSLRRVMWRYELWPIFRRDLDAFARRWGIEA